MRDHRTRRAELASNAAIPTDGTFLCGLDEDSGLDENSGSSENPFSTAKRFVYL